MKQYRQIQRHRRYRCKLMQVRDAGAEDAGAEDAGAEDAGSVEEMQNTSE